MKIYNPKSIFQPKLFSSVDDRIKYSCFIGNSFLFQSLDNNFAIDPMTSYATQGEFDVTYTPLTSKIKGSTANDRIDGVAEALNVNDSLSRAFPTPVSDTKWVLRFHYSMTGQSLNGSGYEMFPSIGLSSADLNTVESNSQDGLSFNPYQDNLVRSYHIAYADGHNLAGDRGGGNTRVTTFTETATVGDDYYIQLARTTATNLECAIYSNSSYSTLVESKALTIPSTVTGLQYFVIKNRNPSQNQTGSQTFWIDDVGFQDNVDTWV